MMTSQMKLAFTEVLLVPEPDEVWSRFLKHHSSSFFLILHQYTTYSGTSIFRFNSSLYYLCPTVDCNTLPRFQGYFSLLSKRYCHFV